MTEDQKNQLDVENILKSLFGDNLFILNPNTIPDSTIPPFSKINKNPAVDDIDKYFDNIFNPISNADKLESTKFHKTPLHAFGKPFGSENKNYSVKDSPIFGIGAISSPSPILYLQRQHLIDDLTPIFTQCLIDNAKALVTGTLKDSDSFPKGYVLCSYSNSELKAFWFDLKANEVLDKNPSIKEIIFIDQSGDKSILCSRESK